ncbi:mannose-1-phosphate guanylyltransferase/mannose-6-phosphate isomerase [archaeon SCG-AAA382B04]|nr:mannose-1-phosphate guanylyltransferase/mannose-6-phosphate isomerase [archaeon SCG-AAA382B04]
MIGVVLAGGTGTRLWPLSRELYPKQFLEIGSDKSLIQRTVSRCKNKADEVLVITNQKQSPQLEKELSETLDEVQIIEEPLKKGTGPAIISAALFIKENFGDEPFLVLPSDHVLDKDFFEVAKKAENLSSDYLITFGVKPSYPATGYGYIMPENELETGYEVESFREKPSKEEAKKLLNRDALWNAGIFLLRPSILLSEVKKHCEALYQDLGYKEYLKNYENHPKTSIDYAVMEDSNKIATVPYKGKWKDIGSWKAIYELLSEDENGNISIGDDIHLKESENSFFYSKNRLIAGIGTQDLVVIDTEDALLVVDIDKSEEVKDMVKQLQSEDRKETIVHPSQDLDEI